MKMGYFDTCLRLLGQKFYTSKNLGIGIEVVKIAGSLTFFRHRLSTKIKSFRERTNVYHVVLPNTCIMIGSVFGARGAWIVQQPNPNFFGGKTLMRRCHVSQGGL